MKKILISLAILASMQFADAQVKSVAEATKGIEKALAASENPKKATKGATWMKLGQAYVDAFDAPYGNIWAGMSKQELQLVLNEQPQSVEVVELMGQAFSKETYAEKVLYFDQSGKLSAIEVKNTVTENPLSKAADAFLKAFEVQPSKEKNIKKSLDLVTNKMVQEGYSQYTIGNADAALQLFRNAVNVEKSAPLNRLDTAMVYNVGFIAFNTGKNDIAKEYFQICLDNRYYGSDGDVYAKMAAVDQENAENYLQEGFRKFPESQSILFGLINYYVQKGDGTDKLFTLLDEAKKSDPNNPSIYNVEGDAYARVGNLEKALEAYKQSTVIDPNFAVGYIQIGCLYLNQARGIYEKAATEMDNDKYNKMCEEADDLLKKSIEPLEKGYELAEGANKMVAAENLKVIFFSLREQSAEYEANYNKYNEIVKNAQ